MDKDHLIELISNSLVYESKDSESIKNLSDFKNYLTRLNLDQFLKLTECEMHVFRILEKKIELRNKIRFVDFKKRKKIKS